MGSLDPLAGGWVLEVGSGSTAEALVGEGAPCLSRLGVGVASFVGISEFIFTVGVGVVVGVLVSVIVAVGGWSRHNPGPDKP